MLSKLFRPKWQHKSADVRKQAVQQLNPQKDLEIILSIALNDSETAVRQAAITHIASLKKLHKLFESTPHAGDKSFIQQCLCSVLANEDLTSALQAENYVLDCKSPIWLVAIIEYCPNASLQALAITGLRDEKTILQFLEQSKQTRAWAILCEQLHNEEALKKAAQLVKGRDKKSSQIIKQKLDNLEQERLQAQQKQQHIEQLHEKLQHLLTHEHTPLMEGILLNAQQQFEQLDDQHALYQPIKTALQQGKEKLNTIQQQALAKVQQQDALTKAQKTLQALSSTLTFDASLLSEISAQKEQAREQSELLRVLLETEHLAQLIQQIAPYLAQIDQRDVNQLNHADYKTQLEALNTALLLSQRHNALKAKYYSDLQQRQAQFQKAQQTQKNQVQQQRHELETLIQQADTAITENNFKKVRALQQRIKTLSRAVDEHNPHYQAALQRIQAANVDLHDWREFATEPKREALCEQMQALSANDAHPLEKSKQIKALHEQWKALGFSKDQQIWQRFQELSTQAYAPCKEYFAQQKQIKQFNAEQCTTICQHLESFLAQIDWAQADFKSIDKLYRNIEQEWKKYSPLERHHYQALNARYQPLMQQIQQQLKQEKQKNTERLQTLVNQAHALLNEEDIQAALNQYHDIHEQWKTVGLSFFKTQRELWQALREAGDALYEKRSQQRNEAEETLQANLNTAKALIDKIHQASNETELEEIKLSFNALGSLPKNQSKQVHNDYQKALRAFKNTQEKAMQQQFHQQLHALMQWAQAGSVLDAIPEQWPATWREILNDTNAQQNNDLRALCIALEILTESETPEADQALRMKIQMEQLAKHFGQNKQTEFEHNLVDLLLRFAAINAAIRQQQPIECARFQQTFDRALAQA